MERTMLQGFSRAVLLAAFGALAACGGGGSDDSPTPPPPTDTTPPTVPANLAATAPSATQVQLTWSASTDASGVAGYRVYRDGGTTPIASPTTTSYTDNSVVASTTYSYTVRAFDAATPSNQSALSGAVNVTTPGAPPDTTAPSVPANVVATAPTPTQVQLTWNASTDAGGSGLAGYRVYRNGSATPLASPTTNSYTDNSVVANTTYSYTVRAFDAATPPNESALSAAANVTTPDVSQPPVSGLDTRPSNTSCLAGAEPTATLAVSRVFPNLSFSAPVQMQQAPGDTSRWFVVQKGGAVRVFPNQADATAGQVSTFFQRSVYDSGESGLLGIAFHPSFPTDPRAFIFYINQSPHESRLAVVRTTNGGATLDASTEVELLSVPREHTNHNGGQIGFGPDGYLYVSTGDGGGGGDDFPPIGHGQNIQTLLGKMLRIDVGGASSNSYTIPASNPFAAAGGSCTSGTTADTDGCQEIYAFGFRNPWRWSFDTGTNELWVADVGQNAWEEVNKVVLGGNYGWRCREGANDYLPASCGNRTPRIDPVAQYDHSAGFSITGGFVYRGTAIPSLVGRYVFGDYGSNRIWNIAGNTAPTLTVTASQGFSSGRNMSAFAQDAAGEIYIVDINNGNLYQLVQQTSTGGSVQTLFSATGCGADADPKLPAPGLIPYAPNAGFWSDGLDKTRWLALPNGATINPGSGDWDLPNGSVLRKDFHLGTRLVETRLFMRHTNGNWAGYTYEWNAQGTDATRVANGKTVDLGTQDWIFPSEAQCLACHTSAAGRSLGLETAQLNGSILYPTTGRTANQIVTINHIGMLNPAIADDPATLPVIPDPYGTSGTQAERARAWLHTNCSFCHRPGGTASSMDLRYTTGLAGTNTCNVMPQSGDLGLPNARIIVPGVPTSSVLLERIDRRDGFAMPPLASLIVDDEAVQLIQAWITGLTGCN